MKTGYYRSIVDRGFRASILSLFCGLLGSGGLSWSAADLAEGLISHWPMDVVIQGEITPDVVGGYHLRLSNLDETDLTDGQRGRAFNFSASREALLYRIHEAGEALPANQYEAWTFCLWAKVRGVGQTDRRLFSEAYTEHSNPRFSLGTHQHGASGQLSVYVRNNLAGWTTVRHSNTISEPFDGAWHHLAFVQESGQRRVYVDGKLEGIEIPSLPDDGSWSLNVTSIGGSLGRGSASFGFVTGVLDEAAVWRRALSEAELEEVRETGIPESVNDGFQAPLEISFFDVDFPAVVKGDTVTLRWYASADATLTIDPGVGDVTARSSFGAGSATMTLESSRSFTLTAERDDTIVQAKLQVKVLDDVADGWRLLDNFETWEPNNSDPLWRWEGDINRNGSWNSEGGAVVEARSGNQYLTFLTDSVLSALDLKSLALGEGEKATLFFRLFVHQGFDWGNRSRRENSLSVGLTDRTIVTEKLNTFSPERFHFYHQLDNIGPEVEFSHSILGSNLAVAIKGRNSWPEIIDESLSVDSGNAFNVWLDIDNRSAGDGVSFSVHLQQIGEERRTLAIDRRSVTDFTRLNALFISVYGVGQTASLDDFYLGESGEFLATVPIALQQTVFLPEVPASVAPEIVITHDREDSAVTLRFDGALYRSWNVTGPYERLTGAVSPFVTTLTDNREESAVFFLARPN